MRQQFNKYTLIVVAGVITFLLLGGVALAGWSRGDANYEWYDSDEDVKTCGDGLVFGLASKDTYNDTNRFVIAIFEEGQVPGGDDPLNPAPPGLIASKEVALSENNWPEPFCTDFDPGANPAELKYCGGPFHIAEDLSSFSQIEAGFYAYDPPFDQPEGFYFKANVRSYEVDPSCSINPTVNITQTGDGGSPDVVKEKLVFEAEAYDSFIGPNNGDGIDDVDMYLIDPDGVQVRHQSESNVPYCVWGGSNPCPVRNFAANNYEWPGNILIKNGTHTLRATANTPDGRSKTVNKTIQIQLPLLTNLLQTGPGTDAATVSETLVFQLEAYVGPRYSDGQDIDNVDMSLIGPDGAIVRQKTENGQPYCLFGGGNPCPVWNFADNDYQWPDGQPIQNGAHTLRAVVNTTDGRSETVEFSIQIQLPLVTNLVQTGPGTTSPVISDTLVFQVEAHVGPNNSDGDDIDTVELAILNANNVTIHQQTDNQAPYCGFGGASSCSSWVFADHADQWPDGQPIQNGAHTLRAVVNTTDGRSETVEFPLDLQLPSAEAQKVFVYLPAVLK